MAVDLSLNVRGFAVTQIGGQALQGASQGGGTSWAVDGSGVYLLGGEDDAGSAISWEFRTPLVDFGRTVSLRSVELSGEFAGEFKLGVFDDRGQGRTYTVRPRAFHSSRQHVLTVPLGSRYHFARHHYLAFSGSADFALDSVSLLVISRGQGRR